MTVPRYLRPRSLTEALELLAEHGDAAYALAGGTAYALLRKQGLVDATVLVDLGDIPELEGIEPSGDGGLDIGAMATLRQVETSDLVRRRAPTLAAVAGRVATVRIRNQATLGGNLAHADPAQDPPVGLLVLDATVEIASAEARRRVALQDFFVDVFETTLGPGELLTRVSVPAGSGSSLIGFEKFLPRTADDYATVSVAARLDLDEGGILTDARICLGSVAATPLRATEAESRLRGASVEELPVDDVAEAVVAAVDPVDDARGTAVYKREMAGIWTARLLHRLALRTVAA